MLLLKLGTKNVTTSLSEKHVLKAEIIEHLEAFIHLVKANYKETVRATELAACGFQD